jgi:hypothetical protein
MRLVGTVWNRAGRLPEGHARSVDRENAAAITYTRALWPDWNTRNGLVCLAVQRRCIGIY